MKVKIIIYFSLILFSLSGFTQNLNLNFDNDINFLLYLGQNGQYADIDFQGEKLLNQKYLNLGQKDTLNYFLGFLNYKRSIFIKSIHYLSNVSDESMFYPKASFYTELSYVEQQEFKTAYNYIKAVNIDSINDLLLQLKSFELAGLSLLNRDYITYDSLSHNFNSTNSVLNSEQQYLIKDNFELKSVKRKSPLLAGTLSAVVPGLGLAYAGNNGQALAAFLRVVSLGALTAETYMKLGPKNPEFIVSATLFSFFYMGNIWGSVLSVQIVKNEKLNEIDHNIIVGLRIPIDNFFK